MEIYVTLDSSVIVAALRNDLQDIDTINFL